MDFIWSLIAQARRIDMGMRIGSAGAASAQAVQSSVAQWQQAKVALPATAPAPTVAPTAQLIATLTKGNNVNTYA
jgi:hypothetical protein